MGDETQAIQAIETLGGKIVRDENLPGTPVIEVEFTQVTDAGLKEVARLKRLSRLNLARTQVSDAGLKELAGLEWLAFLNLSGTSVTDAGLKELAPLKRLQQLIVTNTKATEAGVAELQKALPYCNIQE